MKRIFSMLFALCASLPLGAQGDDHTMLKLRLSDRSPIAVSINGRYFDRQTSSLTLDGLPPGRHRIEIYRLIGYRLRPVRVYTGTIRLEGGTINSGLVDVYRRTLNLRTVPMDEERVREYRDRGERNDDDFRSGSSPDDGISDTDEDDIYEGGRNRDPVPGHQQGSHQEGFGSFPRGRADRPAASAGKILTDREFDDLRKKTGSHATDTEKGRLLRESLEGRSFRTAQVRRMLSWLSFESSRLEFAKWAYPRVADPKNYPELEDAFSFKASKKEFRDAIRP